MPNKKDQTHISDEDLKEAEEDETGVEEVFEEDVEKALNPKKKEKKGNNDSEAEDFITDLELDRAKDLEDDDEEPQQAV